MPLDETGLLRRTPAIFPIFPYGVSRRIKETHCLLAARDAVGKNFRAKLGDTCTPASAHQSSAKSNAPLHALLLTKWRVITTSRKRDLFTT